MKAMAEPFKTNVRSIRQRARNYRDSLTSFLKWEFDYDFLIVFALSYNKVLKNTQQNGQDKEFERQ